MKNSFLFMFSFDDEDPSGNDESISSVYLIRISTENTEELIKYFDGDGEESERFNTMISDNEDYGVHDVGFMPDYFIMGMNSYEVEVNERVTVVNNIRDFFIDEGFEDCEVISEGIIHEMGYLEEQDIAHKYLSPQDLKALNDLR